MISLNNLVDGIRENFHCDSDNHDNGPKPQSLIGIWRLVFLYNYWIALEDNIINWRWTIITWSGIGLELLLLWWDSNSWIVWYWFITIQSILAEMVQLSWDDIKIGIALMKSCLSNRYWAVGYWFLSFKLNSTCLIYIYYNN